MSTFKISALSILAVIFFVGWLTFVYLHSSITKEIGNLGEFGDSFGFINALFAAGAFISVLVSLKSQNDELHRQRFEASYFQLLELLRELRDQAEYPPPLMAQQQPKGVDAIAKIYNEMLSMAAPVADPRKVTKETWAGWYDQACAYPAGNSLGPYFRVMYSMLQRVSKDTILTDDEKVRYGNLLRGQLSTHEIGLVGWNGLTKGSKDFSKFINEFRLLKYLNEPTLQRVFSGYYSAEAFEGRED